MFHSSKIDIKGNYLTPHPSWVINYEKAVFGANRRYVSLMFGGNKWNDDEIGFETVDGKWTATEMVPNAFEKKFKGVPSYVYKVDKSSFKNDKRLGLQGTEKISFKKVKILSKEYIPDLWEELQKTPIEFVFY